MYFAPAPRDCCAAANAAVPAIQFRLVNIALSLPGAVTLGDMRRLFILQMLGSLCSAMQKKGKSPKPPEVVILEVKCQRSVGDVLVDGRVRVQGERPFNKLQLLIDFLGSDKQLMTTKTGEVSGEILDPGEELEFHMRVAEPTGVVYFSLRAEDGNGRDLRVDKAGPYTIE